MAAYSTTWVLVVDDSRTTVMVIRKLLSHIGIKNVDDAANGLEALVKMSERNYDLLIADWNMEPMSGYELLKQIRSDPFFAKTRVIIMSAQPKAEQVVAVKEEGAFYIRKPFTADALREKIATLSLSPRSQRERVPS
jgi:two-component system, chemotaxis family, chemotaxis protein CheY